MFGRRCRYRRAISQEVHQTDKACAAHGATAALTEVWAHGGAGGEALARAVMAACTETTPALRLPYADDDSLADKIRSVAQQVYGADGVDFSRQALADLEQLTRLGFARLPVCMAKTAYSLSDNPQLLGRPQGFRLQVRSLSVSAGAGFVVVLCGNIMKMPGLPKVPAAENIDVDDQGHISGLF